MNRRTFHKLFGMGIVGGAGILNSSPEVRALANSSTGTEVHPTDYLNHTDLGWFREAKFGMMIHWGLYSALGGEWRGKQLPVPGQWPGRFYMETNVEMIMEPFRIPLVEYRQIAKQFNPTKFDAHRWVGLAKAAGMKYLVVTAKHQDGFAMFHSKVSKYNIVDATPFQRDPLKELSDACQKEGVRFCVYYSQRDDWENPNSYGNYWDFHERKRNFDKYYEEKALPQVRELLTGYGPIGLIWFDHGLYNVKQAVQMLDLVRGTQPQCLVNSRLLIDPRVESDWPELVGDYDSLGDHQLPPTGSDLYFETPQTMNRCWGYSKFDDNWKSSSQVVHELVNVVSKGGNYLLDVGPTAEGVIPQSAADVLEQVGAWIKRNGESVYDASKSPFGEFPWGRLTVNGGKIYLHVFEWPGDGVLSLDGVKSGVVKAYPLLESNHTLEVSRSGNRISVRMPSEPADRDDTVIVLEIIGSLEVTPPVVVQKGGCALILTPDASVTTGKAVRYYTRNGGYHISKWTSPEDRADWHIDIGQAGRYQVWITYAAQQNSQIGRIFKISIGSESVVADVVDTSTYCFDLGEPCDTGYQYRTYNIGIVDLPQAGRHHLTVTPVEAGDCDLMYLKQIELTPLL